MAEKTITIRAVPETEASHRAVQIHLEVWPIIQKRVANEVAHAFVLHEIEPGAGRQRSMPGTWN